MQKALGLIEAIGLTTAVAALDAASKATDVTLIGVEKNYWRRKAVGVNIQIAGEVAAVRAAVDAGVEAANRVGLVAASHVIPRPHDEVDKLIEQFSKNLNKKEQDKGDKKDKKDEKRRTIKLIQRLKKK